VELERLRELQQNQDRLAQKRSDLLPDLPSKHVEWKSVDPNAELVQALKKKSLSYMGSEVFTLGSGRRGGAKVKTDLAVYSAVAVQRGETTKFLRQGQIFRKKSKRSATFIILGFTVTTEKVFLPSLCLSLLAWFAIA
jgi:hypothetical protein